MYYGDQTCCEKWIISSVKSCFNYAEIPYDASNFPKCWLRGLQCGPSDFPDLPLVPIPRHNLVRYHGVLARGCRQPNSRMRKLIIPKRSRRVKRKEVIKTDKTFEDATSQDELMAPLSWAQRRDGEPLKRVFNIDITLCPICGRTMRVIADITDPGIIQKILDHLTGPPRPQPPPTNPATAIQS